MDRSNHYEAAFEAYLRSMNVGYVAVDETKRSLMGPEEIKSVDFIIVGSGSAKLIVDVKGRKFPGGTALQPRMVWQNWSTQDDIDGLERWARHFGNGYQAVLAFAYHIQPEFALPENTPDTFTHDGRVYLMRGVPVSTYREKMKLRSPKWGTVHVAKAHFKRMIVPFSTLLEERSLFHHCETVVES